MVSLVTAIFSFILMVVKATYRGGTPGTFPIYGRVFIKFSLPNKKKIYEIYVCVNRNLVFKA